MLSVALAQISPVWLQRDATLKKVVAAIKEAAEGGAKLVCFGEGLVPGYPFWVDRTDGARFESSLQKSLFAQYAEQAVCIEDGHLSGVIEAARAHSIAVYLGLIERPRQRTGHSLYASLVYIDQNGAIGSVHRKLMPTYEERLVWSTGDGHGLRVHPLEEFTVGGLNCWENWMPLARAALYGQGENLHVAVWPGSDRNTQDITRFIAKESRSYVLSVGSLMRPGDVPNGIVAAAELKASLSTVAANGGSCIAAPNGEWVVAPQIDREQLVRAELDIRKVHEERHNFDPAGHYSRPDVTELHVNRQRQSTVQFDDG